MTQGQRVQQQGLLAEARQRVLAQAQSASWFRPDC